MSVYRPNLTLVFFKAAYQANPGAVRKRVRSRSDISRNIFENCQMHQLTIMYRFDV